MPAAAPQLDSGGRDPESSGRAAPVEDRCPERHDPGVCHDAADAEPVGAHEDTTGVLIDEEIPSGATRRHVVTGGHTWTHPAHRFNRLFTGS